MAKLILLTDATRKEFILENFNNLGRHPDCSVALLDRIVSKEHAHIIQQADGGFLFRDLGSLNGSYIGSTRVGEQLLRHGDEITMGSTRLLYSEQPTVGESPPVTVAPSSANAIPTSQPVEVEKPERFLPAKDLPADVLKRDYEKLRSFHDPAQALTGIIDIDTLLPKILDQSFALFPAERGAFLLMEGGRLQPKYVKHKDPRHKSQAIVLSNAILNEVTQHKRAVLSADASMDPRFIGSNSIIMQGIRSTMSVPLLYGTELLGILHLDSQLTANAFTERDLLLFNLIANQAAIAIQNARLAQQLTLAAQTRAQLGQLVGPKLVEQLASGQLRLDRAGEVREVTMLYVHICDFVALSEQNRLLETGALLNEYFELLTVILDKWNGSLDKYVGDEIIGLFGALSPQDNAPWQAVQCALEMQAALRDFNARRVQQNLEQIEIGIGINTGMVLVGAIGSSFVRQYTVVGDAVNTAAGLCALAKQGQILLGEPTFARVSDKVQWSPLEPVRLTGKKQPLRIYSILVSPK